MPSARKVSWSQLKVGLMAIAAMALLATLIFLMTEDRGFFTNEVPLYTFMDDSAALQIGAPVRLNGILIGKVSKVTLTGSAQPRRSVRIDMSVRQEMLRYIPVDSEAVISAENVLGIKFINIKQGRETRVVRAGGTIRALDTREFEEVVQSGYNVLTSLQGLIKRLDGIVDQVDAGRGSIGKLLVDDELYNRLVGTVAEAQKVTAALSSGKGTLGRLLYDESLYQEVRAPISRLNKLLAGIEQGEGTAGKLMRDPALYDEMRASVRTLRTLLADLEQGKGTAGKLLRSEELSNQVMATLGKMERTIDQINSGQGTIGQLLVNPSLYESLNGATRDFNALMKDFRADPKKFLRIKLALF